MLYDRTTFAVFDLFLLKREDAADDYPDSIRQAAQMQFDSMSERERERLAHTLVIVTQGFINSAVEESGDYMERFRRSLEQYRGWMRQPTGKTCVTFWMKWYRLRKNRVFASVYIPMIPHSRYWDCHDCQYP